MASVTAFEGSIPVNYDKYLGPVLFEPYALDIIDRLKNDKVKNLLELACGTGRVTKHLAELIPAGGKLVATDLNQAMIDIAKTKVQDGKIEWKVANAQDLSFADDQFDHMVCQYGVMFFPDKEKSFREAYRVLQKGGKYIFNTWETVEKNPRIDTIWQTILEVFPDDPPEFFKKGPYAYNDQQEIEKLLLNAGFTNIRIDSVAKTSNYNGPDDLINGFADGTTLHNYLKQKDTESQQRLRELLKQRLGKQDAILGNTVPSLALVMEATK